MSTPEQSRGPSPVRVGGLALIGAGAVAGLIGLATLLPGGEGSGAAASPAAPTTTSAATSPTDGATSTEAPGGTSAVPVPGFPTGQNGVAATGANGTEPPGGVVGPGGVGSTGTGAGTGSDGTATGGGSGGGSGGVAVATATPVRVYNNSTLTGLAARAADEFRAQGWSVNSVGNYPQRWGVIPTSTVYYRTGTAEQSAADQLGQTYGMRVMPRYAGIDDASPGVIVILTNDFKN